MKKLTNKKGLALSGSKGFTLIEVVLVLAIGGLIFLLAFIAFQQVSTNRRDTQRRSDAGRLVAEVQNYFGDKNALPTAATDGDAVNGVTGTTFNAFVSSYMGGADFKEPLGGVYHINASGTAPAKNQINYVKGDNTNTVAGCKSGTVLSSSNFKIEVGLEKGVTCRDSLGSN